MKCPNCGAEIPDGSKYCSECDTKQQVFDSDNLDNIKNYGVSGLSLREYYEREASFEKKWVNGLLFVSILHAILVSFIIVLIETSPLFVLKMSLLSPVFCSVVSVPIYLRVVEAGVYFVFGLGLLGREWPIPLIIVISSVVFFFLTGGVSVGIISLIVGIGATKCLYDINKSYKQYLIETETEDDLEDDSDYEYDPDSEW